MLTRIDRILASGRYTDRRGRAWTKRITWSTSSGLRMWSHPYRLEPLLGGPVYRLIDEDQMRLLIERDQHRDECRGLWKCKNHPVVRVVGSRIFRGGMTHVMPATGDYYVFRDDDGGCEYWSLPAAMDAAHALAVAS